MKKPTTLALMIALLVIMLPLGSACDEEAESVAESVVAAFTAEPTSAVVSVAVSLPVQFTDQSVGNVTGWEWDFDGDGLTDSLDRNPSYTYEAAGIYDVTLRVTGPDGTGTETKTGYITASAYQWPEMTLRLCNEYFTQVGDRTTQRWADLLEEYTEGKVTVDIFTPFDPGWNDPINPLQEGYFDFLWIHPYFLRDLDPSLYWTGALQNIFTNLAHARAVLEDGRLVQLTADILADEGMHLLGYFEGAHMYGYFNNVREVTEPADMAGMEAGLFREPDSLYPYEEFCGMTGHYVPYPELLPAIINGGIDCIPNSLEAQANQGFVDYLNHGLLQIIYSADTPLMNLETWNSLGEHLQALITDVIVPQVQAYAREIVFEDEKNYLAIMNSQMDSLHLQSPAMNETVYNEIKDYPSYQALAADLDPLIVQVIEELRPAQATLGPEIAEILEHAGIPLPG